MPVYRHYLRPMRFLTVGLILLPVFFSCTSRYFVAVLQPTKTKSIAKSRVKVMVKLSNQTLLGNRIAVINASSEQVSVFPIDIVLEIPKANLTLPAVMDYRNYVSMRFTEANRQCAEAPSPSICSRTIDKYFSRYMRVRPFAFGDINPRKKRTGYFAFNLPDPFNPTGQSREAADKLINEHHILEGIIKVRVSPASGYREMMYEFPVSVITSTDKNKKLLRILRNF